MSGSRISVSQFVEKYSGKKLDWDGKYQGQCVDLFRFYIHEVLRLSQPSGVVGAADFWANHSTDLILKNNFTKIANTPDFIPKEGDVMIWNKRAGGGFGHIAVVVGKDHTTSYFHSFDQNWRAINVSEVTKHTYSNVYGVLRPLLSTQGSMSEELTACLADRKKFWEERDQERAKNESLVIQLKEKQEEIERLRGELAEKSSVIKTLKDEMAQFMEALATKLTSIVDKSAIIGAVDRLISEESEYIKKVQKLEKAVALAEDEKKLEIEALKRSIDELKEVNEKQATHIERLEARIGNIEQGEVRQRTIIDLIQDLFSNFRR